MPRRDPIPLKRAKALRSNIPLAEALLWEKLRARRLGGMKFSRQVPIGPYIVDFAARRERLAIELDGDSHAGRETYDAARTAFIEGQGWHVLRFWNDDIFTNIEGACADILRAAESRCAAPSP
ncbi:endonuclease domain-containing protein [Pacificimonas sp. WHA3]|uniref:Endonuclease domain-containing protein n=1 Tax=Pacificimonas pallii TaxID=2827236 RepID=A0ABS6SES4_9SPHN|nr:DUF559 domain-containing protein [Pacificimonas pallii]MBV7256836.1 endonuclease domain-containing protein [Pacificimonas pallii]